MKLDELLSLLSKKADSYINQSQLAESLGVTRQTISNRIKNESDVDNLFNELDSATKEYKESIKE